MKRYRKWSIALVVFALFTCLCACGKQADSDRTELESESENLVTEATTESTTAATSEEISSEQEDDVTEIEEQTEEQKEAPVYMNELKTSLQDVLSSAGLSANTSIYVQELSEDAYLTMGDGAMQSASLIKLYVAGCVYEQKDTLLESENYSGETEDLVRKMITVSDNDATNTLVIRLGKGNAQEGMYLVNTYCQEHEFTNTFMGRLMLDFSSEFDNYTSAKDCVFFLKKIYNDELAGSEAILGYLKQQERTGKIPAGVPEGIVTANKTGELDDVENDVAIIYGEKTTYIICVMMNDLSDTAVGRDTIVKLSSIAYTFINKTE